MARERLEGLFYAKDDASVAAMITLSGTKRACTALAGGGGKSTRRA